MPEIDELRAAVHQLTQECAKLIIQNRELSGTMINQLYAHRKTELDQMRLVLSRNTWRAQARILRDVVVEALKGKEVPRA